MKCSTDEVVDGLAKSGVGRDNLSIEICNFLIDCFALFVCCLLSFSLLSCSSFSVCLSCWLAFNKIALPF